MRARSPHTRIRNASPYVVALEQPYAPERYCDDSRRRLKGNPTPRSVISTTVIAVIEQPYATERYCDARVVCASL